ncbi:MAG: ATPase, T2SS/T4P/T4SS family [Desulfobacterales bacterium]|nr:ATPase, T2SS/T4P/T4SS family [Desulfobacterales bacterium]MDD3082328.1 ATPase, T2SS/T4P/T4SS family [Desulfobacterales bacterium]MDD3950878.1 ATPase, T2SS/T4P/T4SS family [Desulfobacterales bacterium]MDY0377541.1 ATPase, T2SS/T4P/T4SS family [Desulfobacterales bacterium]
MKNTNNCIDSSAKIGDLLVKEGFVKQSEVKTALEIQAAEAEESRLPMGLLLVKKGLLTEKQIEEIFQDPDIQKNLKRQLLKSGKIEPEALNACLADKKPGEPIFETLKRHALLPAEELEAFRLKQLASPKIGNLAVKLRMVTPADFQRVLEIKASQRTLGEILCDMDALSPLDLHLVLEKYGKRLKLGEILIRQERIDEDDLNEALQERKQRGDRLGRILVQKNRISEDHLNRTIARQYNIPFRKLEDFSYFEKQKATLARIIGQKYAQKHRILPLALKTSQLTLAISRPQNIHPINELRSVYTRLKIRCVLVTEVKFAELFTLLYGTPPEGYGAEASPVVEPEQVEAIELDISQAEVQDDKLASYGIQDMEAEQLVNFIIKYGVMNNASDIHIEQDRRGAKIRYRFDGVLQPFRIKWIDEKLQSMVKAIISRVKVISNLDIAERRIPQDGVFRIKYFDREKDEKFDLDFRVATCPAIVGENVTIRILDSRKANVGLDQLNHSPHVLDPLKEMFKSSAGMVLVTGPTGSGKSTTLYAALQYIYDPGIKIITAEDPIEYNFPGIMQTQINPKINLTFSRLLRSFLRSDPDVILIGEMRDEETARIGFDASQTGHLLLSTLHTNDAVSSITRLLDLNIEYNQIAASLMGVLAQRLIRKACPDCMNKYIPPEDEWSLVFDAYPSHLTFYQGRGCEKCGFSGFRGRSLISELLVVNRAIARALNRGASENELKALAIKEGMKTMIDDGILKMNQTPLSEIIRVVPHEMIKEYRTRTGSKAVEKAQIAAAPEKVPATDLPAERFMLGNPDSEVPLIDAMYERFNALKNKVGDRSSRIEPGIFKDFIIESFRSIQNQYTCKTVTFHLQTKPGKVELFATPNP